MPDTGTPPAWPVSPSSATPPVGPGPVVVPTESVPANRGIVTFFAVANRSGDWALPRVFRVMAIFADVVLDLRNVRLGAGTSEIEVIALLGNVHVIAPSQIHLECDGHPILGEFGVESADAPRAPADAPVVRVSGTSFFSNVKGIVVLPNTPQSFIDKWRESH